MIQDEYLESRVMTASREQLHLMVVDGTLRHCQRAKLAIEAGDFELKWSALSEARAHLTELIAGLGDDQTDVIDQVRALFTFSYRELMYADAESSIDRIESAVKVLQIHRETWVTLMQQIAADQGADVQEANVAADQSLPVSA